MYPHLRIFSLVTATLLLSLTPPFLPFTLKFEPLVVQAQTTQDRQADALQLNQEGVQLFNSSQFQEALGNFQKTLVIFREIGERQREGIILNNIGEVYRNLGQYQQALDYDQQALAITREVGDRSMEGTTLSNIGFLLEVQNQPELAIVFFKQSVNVIEAIRQDIGGLPEEQQQSYTDTVAGIYQHLADLLLKQNRVLEAQRVLGLLKTQELEVQQ